jgi:hypothetical protein
MYAFHHRGDCEVVDEPFYAYYLKFTGADHPMRDEVLAYHEQDAEKVKKELLTCATERPYLFMKNMPHHMIGLDLDFVKGFQNFFLIREPRAMIASYLQKREEVSMGDLGLDLQYQLYTSLTEHGESIPVIDSKILLEQPREVLTKLCEVLEIPFKEGMLSWPAGAIAQDGVWADHWYSSVHASEGFGLPRKEGEIRIPSELESLAAECEGYYQALKKHEIRP